MSDVFSRGGVWYTADGTDNDIVLSSRVRLARNLANFAFPHCLKSDDAEHVQSLVFDVFNRVQRPEDYQAIRVGDIDPLGQRILSERGIISSDILSEPWAGVVVRGDGVLSCTVNDTDHVRIASFAPGLELERAYDTCAGMDSSMQDIVQFAASGDLGYLTSSFFDLGSGLKASALVHLPSISAGGMLDRVLRDFLAEGYTISGYYGAGMESGTSLGSFYQLSNGSAASGNEAEQLDFVKSGVRKLIRLERQAAAEMLKTSPTLLKDQIFRAVAVVKYSRFIGNREGVDLLSKIKWGISQGFIEGIGHRDITALMYRIQNAHLSFVIKSGSFHLEDDVVSAEHKTERLRALVVQEALSGISCGGI